MVLKQMARAWLVVLLLCLFLSISSCGAPPEMARVTQVIDGDTIVIQGGHRVRYIGVDTPETYPRIEACGIEAWRINRELVAGKKVRLERDVSETDKHGRLLRYVWVDDIMVNAELVKRGLARAKAYPPDTRYQDYFTELEAEAILLGRGLWAK